MGRLLGIALALMTLTAKAWACESALPDHVRILDCRLAAAVAEAARRSPTLADLLERVERTDGLVYVRERQPPLIGPATRLLGGLSHQITTAGAYRVLWIFVTDKSDEHAVTVVGHELRHALEVLELSTARTRGDVDAFFERRGWRSGTNVVETQAALDAGWAIERELKSAKRQ